MTKLYNRKEYKQLRRYLRKQPIKPERLLWQRLKNKQTGYKFRRQFSIGRYIVDFYCPQLKIAIEIDGETHYQKEGLKNDKIRQKYLENLSITVKRYLNNEIYNNIDNVVSDIIEACDKKVKK